jgi:FdhD protein
MTIESIKQLSIIKFANGHLNQAEDILAIEEPLEIALIQEGAMPFKKPVSITMRTPGKDIALATGFLFTEGIIQDPAHILKVEQLQENEVLVHLDPKLNLDLSRLDRHFYTNSSCGVCGKSSVDQLRSVSPAHLSKSTIQIEAEVLFGLNQQVRNAQSVFERTGGIHASALFESSGKLCGIFEDVGRHNALDKLIGHAIQNLQYPLNNYLLFLSGRASFELIQKAAMAGIPVVCALGAPSSMAVELATEFNITLIGFLKNDTFNIYSVPERIVSN